MAFDFSRRAFLRAATMGTLGAFAKPLRLTATDAETTPTLRSKVAIAAGNDRADNVFRSLMQIRDEVAAASRGKRIIIKPNCVIHIQDAWRYNGVPADLLLSDSSVQQIEGILEFFMHIGRHDLVIAESCATGPTFEAFDNLGYFGLRRNYPVQFVETDHQPFKVFQIQSGMETKECRCWDAFWDPDTFIVSAPKLKTHNNAVATLSLKNVVMGAPMNYASSGNHSKAVMHGLSNQDLHDNIFRMAQNGCVPDLAVIDGFEGMQGNGPNHGTPVHQRLAIASCDFLAADRIGLELMGVADRIQSMGWERQYPAYLEYCALGGLGKWNLSDIEVLGPPIETLQKSYELHDLIDTQINLHPLPPGLRTSRWNPAAPHCPPLNGAWAQNA